jgi:RNA polymerase sigma factor (sigma-70 family)
MTRAREWSTPAARHVRSRCEHIAPITADSAPRATTRCAHHLCACHQRQSCGHNLSPYMLLSRHAATVHTIAASLSRKRYLPLNEDELAQCGHIALIELSRRHVGLTDALIWQRIRGSMLDACRREGWYGRRREDNTPRRHVALTNPADLDLDHQADIAPHADDTRLRAALRDALATLPELDQAILLQHDLDQIPLREIAKSMRRAPSRLSHRRSAALSSLRRTLEARGIRSSADLI